MREVAMAHFKQPLEETAESMLFQAYNQPGGTNRYVSTVICNPYDENFKLSAIPYDRVYPLKKVKFGDTESFIPNDPEYLLGLQFGYYYDLPLFRRGGHVNHDNAAIYCKKHKISIIEKNDVEMIEEYSDSMKSMYEFVSSHKGLQYDMISMLMEYRGVGTKKNLESALKRLNDNFDRISKDVFYFTMMYDVLVGIGGSENLERADKLVMESRSSSPDVLLRRGKTAIRTRDHALYKTVLDDMMEIDYTNLMKLIDEVVKDGELIDALDPYEACCTLAGSGFRKAMAYKAIMEIYGIHCEESFDANAIDRVQTMYGIDEIFFDLLWKYKERSPGAFFAACLCMTSDTGLRNLYLARAYRDGIGVKADNKIAYFFMKKAADMKVDGIEEEYFDVLWNMDDPKTDLIAYNYVHAADRSNKLMDLREGRMYASGRGVGKDLDAAAIFLRKAVANKVKGASVELIGVLWEINDPETDKEMASLAIKGSKFGNGNSMVWLARCFRDGRGIETNRTKAAAWFRRASAKKVPFAAEELKAMK